MDGRPHPPAWAPHSWMGFSTGRFVGNALEVQTTHLKQGWLRRNGLPESDQATMIEFFVRHGDRLLHTSVVTDPVYLAEPRVVSDRLLPSARSITRRGSSRATTASRFWTARADDVPNYAFGEQPVRQRDSAISYKIPAAAYLGGPETMSSGSTPAAWREPQTLTTPPRCVPRSAAPTSRAVDPEPRDGEVHIWPHPRPTCICSSATKATSSCRLATKGACRGRQRIAARLADKTVAAIRQLSDKPVQFIANTNCTRRAHRRQRRACARPGPIRAFADPSSHCSSPTLASAPRSSSHQNVQNRMTALKRVRCRHPERHLSSRNDGGCSTTTIRSRSSGSRSAVTDGDSIVHFRRADVIVAGDIFTTTQYPVIDVSERRQRAGRDRRAERHPRPHGVSSTQGEGGTIVVPGHGYVSDEHEVVEYRDMVVIVRDRVQALIKSGRDARAGEGSTTNRGLRSRDTARPADPWTTDMFVEAVCRSLTRP